MQIGQNIQLLSSSTYGEYYDAPTISSRPYGVTAGIIGKITKLNVAGVSDTNTFTEFEKLGEKFYVKNGDFGTDFEAVDASATTGNTGGGTGSGSGNGGSFIDTLGKFFDFAKGIFGKKETTTPETKPGNEPAKGGGTGENPEPANNDSGILGFLKKSWYWILIVLVVLGGVIWWGVSAAKKKTTNMMGNNQNQNPNRNGNPPI